MNKNNYLAHLILVISLFFLSSCDSKSENVLISGSLVGSETTITLENTTILEKGSNVGETFSFQIDKSDFDANKRFEWKIVSSPEGVVTPQILVDATTTTMSFVPSVRGTYEIQVSDGVIKRDFTAVANYEAPFNQGKIHKDSASAKSFSVVNQFVFRTNLNEKDIIDIINKYPKIKFIDLYKTKLLIEVDDEIDIETMEQLELLKLEKSVRYIGERNFFKDLTSMNL